MGSGERHGRFCGVGSSLRLRVLNVGACPGTFSFWKLSGTDWGHALIFALFSFCLCLALKSCPGLPWYWVLAAVLGTGVVLAVTTEVLQAFVPCRHCGLKDMAVDVAGALAGVFCGMCLVGAISS